MRCLLMVILTIVKVSDIMYFGENSGKQCVAMSLCALIYNKINGIHSCNDLVQIMEMNNKKNNNNLYPWQCL